MKMRPGERIKLIREISERMNQEDFTVIDLILREFDLPTQDTWNGDKSSYVIQMVKDDFQFRKNA